uniref:heat shock cognate 70 kDa protein n=1 Tax=Erigeron canadensis TaxID=72917 RepID=UPI001CB8CF15|nr:heat shock cognate 70 kDa protein [Erigeron canadensis]
MSQSSVKRTAIGIDLGTTYSCAAAWFRQKNRVEIIPNEQGNHVTPSFVAVNDTEIVVGEGAKLQIIRKATNTIFDVKRMIGKRFQDPQLQKDLEAWPFKIIEGPRAKPNVVVEFEGKKKTFAPEELSAMVLKKIKEVAEKFLGTEVTDAVITVPAYFNNQQREATKEAGKLAGLNVLRLINEPTAAAVAYGVDNMGDTEWNKDKNVLVFDLGGGTFDVSLLTVSKKGGIVVKAVGGDTHLGGDEFDTALLNHCIEEFQKMNEHDIRGNPRALGRLKVACEKAKRDLSSTSVAYIELDCLHMGFDFSITISRAKFEELNSVFFRNCIQLVENCLNDGNMKKDDIDEVVLVGGSTRIPKIQQMLKDFFDGKTLCMSMNGDEAVAFGAAILASRLAGETDGKEDMIQDVVLQDVTPLSLGIKAGKNGEMKVIIPRNTPVPTRKRKIFYSSGNNSAIHILVYQGESVNVEENLLLGEFNLYGITLSSTDGVAEIEICFSIDVNGILLVSGKEISTGQKKTTTIAKT